MPDFKLISADSHVDEPPHCLGARTKKEYGERAAESRTKIHRACQRYMAVLIDGMSPVGLSHFSKGLAVEKAKGISKVDQEKHFETIRFDETCRFEEYPGRWNQALA